MVSIWWILDQVAIRSKKKLLLIQWNELLFWKNDWAFLKTNKSLEDIFNKAFCVSRKRNKLKDDLLRKFDEKISKQNGKIEKLESIISIHENTIDQLLVKCDDNEQYSRRSCLRVHGKKRRGKESEGDVMNTFYLFI